ncbi:MAG: DUF4440 domain-containing protein [Cytophagales bacterium]|nr:DUF4440 domain-containing protein [Cytophagales bacterium]
MKQLNMKVHILLVLLIISGCQRPKNSGSKEQWKTEILNTENSFSALSAEKGVKIAFQEFAANDAVLMRNNELIKGMEAMSIRLDGAGLPPDVTLTWEPSFVDVSESGDLGYTYGEYLYTSTDSLGNVTKSTGIFHTVWKRQTDGEWKFVWD